jgi:4-amino-4-deoxy-L-arabinose transferase-like glycosyltransferase
LIVGIKIFFIYVIKKEKKIRLKYFIPGTIFILVFLPHLIWLVENDYITLTYALHRTGFDEPNYINHLFHSFIFLGKQIGILIPFFVMILFVISKFKIQFNMKDKKLLFLLAINIIPIFLMFLTSLFMGIKIRTMWMTPFYLFIGVLFTYILQKKIAPKKLKYFFSVFLVLFIFSPITYFVISITQTDKRTDYPGKKVSQMVQEKWENNFENKIGLVAGDEWYGGNLSYHLKSRPKWDNILIAEKTISLENIEGGFIIIGDKNNLSTICSGIFLEVETQGVCMIGKKK